LYHKEVENKFCNLLNLNNPYTEERLEMKIDSIVGFVGVFIGILGIILSYFFYLKSIRVKKPFYLINNNNLFRDNLALLNGLDILYNGNRVENLSISQVAFWNKGNEIIDNSDIVKTEPLRIESKKNIQILDSKIITENNPTNEFVLKPIDMSRVEIQFDFIEKNDGVVIQVIHTGVDAESLVVRGKIKGAEIKTYSEKFNMFVAFSFIGYVCLLLLSYLFPKEGTPGLIASSIQSMLIIVLLCTSILVNLDGYFRNRRGVPKSIYNTLKINKKSK
jgi:hypothetical protein